MICWDELLKKNSFVVWTIWKRFELTKLVATAINIGGMNNGAFCAEYAQLFANHVEVMCCEVNTN